ncbi:probable serine/threonine-protein kinase clkA [Limulus polyphemus]|uniref:Probable serine/threonine-protein kinase clkA n=1 Tax=Limulus polyphemus TaxID=6850 RepID=A0ABM1S117_LIMPO|nr:probable serine/threonine-protein kinase clkA [Limulus polyphemus]
MSFSSIQVLVLVLLCNQIVFAVDKTNDAESKRDTNFGNRSPSLDKFDNRNIDRYRPDNDYDNRYDDYHNYRPDYGYDNRYDAYNRYRPNNGYDNLYNNYHRYRPDNGYNRYDDYHRYRPDNGYNKYDDYPYDNRFDVRDSMYNPQRSYYNNNRYDDHYNNGLRYRDPYANRYNNRYYRRYPYNNPYGDRGYGDDPYYDRDYPGGSRYDDSLYSGRDPYYDPRYGNSHPYNNRYDYRRSLQPEDKTINTPLSSIGFATDDRYPRKGTGTFTPQSIHSGEDKGFSRSYTNSQNSRTFSKTE